MSRKVSIVLIALLAILLVANWHIFGMSAGARLFDWLLIVFIINRAYREYQKANLIKVPTTTRPLKKSIMPSSIMPLSTSGTTILPGNTDIAGQLRIVGLVILFVFLFAAYQITGAAAFNFFVWGDHVLRSGNTWWPVTMWAIAGLLLGAVVGSFVMWKKYHIKLKWCLVTLIPFLIILFCLHVISEPLQAIKPPPLTAATDSSVISPTYTKPEKISRKKGKYRRLKPTASVAVAQQPSVQVNPCAKELAVVTINARSDSVNVYYRIASYQDGPWGSWKSKFIPQQGQFSLTDGNPVIANSIQYYYEIKSVLTRSEQNPYTRQLCEGQLIINTY